MGTDKGCPVENEMNSRLTELKGGGAKGKSEKWLQQIKAAQRGTPLKGASGLNFPE